MICKYILYIECVVSYGRMMNNGQLSINKLLDMVFESTYYGLVIVEVAQKFNILPKDIMNFVECRTVIGEH